VSPRCLSLIAETAYVFKYQARRPEKIIRGSLEKPLFHERDTYKWWVLITVSLGRLTVAGSLFNSYKAEILDQLSHTGIGLSTAKKWLLLPVIRKQYW
jgi:hypothetical protein